MSELYHYGRKGMKWGQHIYGKERIIKRKSKTNFEDHEKIYNSLDSKQKKFLTGENNSRRYNETYDDYKYGLYKQVIYKVGKTPVAFCDAWLQQNKSVELAIATDKRYQGKGYGSKVLRTLLEDLKIDVGSKKISDIVYAPEIENEASNKTAVKNGLTFAGVHKGQGHYDGLTYNVYKYKR